MPALYRSRVERQHSGVRRVMQELVAPRILRPHKEGDMTKNRADKTAHRPPVLDRRISEPDIVELASMDSFPTRSAAMDLGRPKDTLDARRRRSTAGKNRAD